MSSSEIENFNRLESCNPANFESAMKSVALARENPHDSAKRRVLCRLPFPPDLGAMEVKMTPAEYTGRVLCFREHKDWCFRDKTQKTENSSSQSSKQPIKDDSMM